MKLRNKNYFIQKSKKAPRYRHLATYTMISPDDIADSSKS